MCIRIVLLSFLSLLIACGNDADGEEANGQKSDTSISATAAEKTGQSAKTIDRYELKQINKQVEDEYAPLGYWEQKLMYPVLLKGGTPSGRSRINTAIERYVDSFRCEEPGEFTFNSAVRYVDESVLSFTYSAMWLCSGMAHPDSASGTFNANLNTSERIELENQLKNQPVAERLADKVLAGLKQAMKKNETDLECAPADDWRQFYLTDQEFVFVYYSPVHGQTPCDAEFRISRTEMRNYLRKDSVLLN